MAESSTPHTAPLCTQITHCSDKYSPEDIVRLVNGLEVAPNGLIEYKSKVNLFVSK